MNGPQVTLASGKVVSILVGSGEKEVSAFHKGEKIIAKKRTTTIKIMEPLAKGQKEEEGVVLAEVAVSCSHKDKFVKANGRKEAWKRLVEQDKAKGEGGLLTNREDRLQIVRLLNIADEEPKLKDKEEAKKQKAINRARREAREKKEAEAKAKAMSQGG